MNAQRSEQGFSLIEVLVAFAILVLAMGALMTAFGSAATLSSVSQDRALAMDHAQSVLDGLDVEPSSTPAHSTGRFEDGFRWIADVTPYGSKDDREAWIADPYEIKVRVLWGQQHIREVQLQTLRLLPRQIK